MDTDSQTEQRKTAQVETKSGSKYRNLILIGLIYAAWLICLLYVGLVNYRAGNQ